jgi:hypothetical protein
MEPKPPLPPHSGTVRRKGRNVSVGEESRVEMGVVEEETARRDVVVRM